MAEQHSPQQAVAVFLRSSELGARGRRGHAGPAQCWVVRRLVEIVTEVQLGVLDGFVQARHVCCDSFVGEPAGQRPCECRRCASTCMLSVSRGRDRGAEGGFTEGQQQRQNSPVPWPLSPRIVHAWPRHTPWQHSRRRLPGVEDNRRIDLQLFHDPRHRIKEVSYVWMVARPLGLAVRWRLRGGGGGRSGAAPPAALAPWALVPPRSADAVRVRCLCLGKRALAIHAVPPARFTCVCAGGTAAHAPAHT